MEKSAKRRYIICASVVCLVLASFVLRLVDWQIVHGKENYYKASSGYSSILKTEPLRGEIVDVNGVPLAVNSTEYELVFDRFAMPKDRENEVILRLFELFRLKNEPWIDDFPIIVGKNGSFEFEEGREKDTDKLKGKNRLNMNSYATAADCMEKLTQKFGGGDLDASLQRDLISVRENMDATGYYRSLASSYIFARGISPELISIILEKMQDVPGINIKVSSVRYLENSDLMPHIVGNVGKMSEAQYEKLKGKGYTIEDVVGKSGIESALEDELRGYGGEKRLEVSRKSGAVSDISQLKDARPGHTVFLTIDSRLQKVAMESLAKNVQSAGAKAGSVVAINVKNGEILAAATYPSYDAAKLSEPGYFEKLSKDATRPLFNRAFLGAEPPGSTFKPVVALAALGEGKMTDKDTVHCSGIYHYPGAPRFTTKCLGVHGNTHLYPAMSKSCNVYFSEAARLVTVEKLNMYCERLGLGVRPNLELPATAGSLSGEEYYKSAGMNWTPLNTIKAGIGQDTVALSMLQLANYTATIANGGHHFRPHLVRKITDYTRQQTIFENDPQNPTLENELGVPMEILQKVRKSMREPVLSGTATNFLVLEKPVAAKTGTAQVANRPDHTLCICYGPHAENPDDAEIAIACIIENGVKGIYSKEPIKAILQEYFNIKNAG